MNLQETLAQLEALGTEKMRAQNAKNGAHDRQYGVRLGDLRTLAKKIKTNHDLALALWKTGNIDAQLLAVLLLKPRELSTNELDQMVRSVSFLQVADWLGAYVVKKHPEKEVLRQAWLASDDPMAVRAGWSLTAERVAKTPDGIDLAATLDRLQDEMAAASPEAQWTMNSTLVEIGIHHPDYRTHAIELGEKLGLYRDYPVSKGCTSPFAPAWIREMVSRQS